MKKVNKLAMCAILAPALTVGAGSVYAQTSTHSTAEDSALEQRTSQDRARPGSQDSQYPGTTSGQSGQSGTTHSRQGQHEHGSMGSGSGTSTAQRPGGMMGGSDSSDAGKQLSQVPANAFHADSLLGKDINSQVGDEKAGTISDFVIDEDGQVLAVVVGIGGMLGIGERNVAIAWDSLTHTRDEDGDSKFTTSMTKEALRDAPDYDRDADASTSRSDRSSGTTGSSGQTGSSY